MNRVLRWILFLGIVAGTVGSFLAPDAEGFQKPALARIVFFHLPCALGSTLFLALASYFAARYLAGRQRHWDVRCQAAFEMAMALGSLTLATGILFSKVQWLAWWNWDPRQTSFLIVMLIVGAYFALRSGFTDEHRRAVAASAYAMASLLPILFLVFIYPRLPLVKSLHPDVVREGGFDATYRAVFLSLFALITFLAAWIYRMRVRVALLEIGLEKAHARLADRDRPASSGVVRPVSLPPQGGGQA